jgi:hypothetical protein
LRRLSTLDCDPDLDLDLDPDLDLDLDHDPDLDLDPDPDLDRDNRDLGGAKHPRAALRASLRMQQGMLCSLDSVRVLHG